MATIVSPPGYRVLMYSHDTFGLGHLRRTLLLAEEISALPEVSSILITTGSPDSHTFALPPGCDTVKLPALNKIGVEAYEPRSLSIPSAEAMTIRSNLIATVYSGYRPDLVVVDHAPVGVGGELIPMFRRMLASPERPTMVLGLRDIIDEPTTVRQQWEHLGVWPVLDQVYDRILVYGDEAVTTTAQELGLDRLYDGKLAFTGYLTRQLDCPEPPTEQPTILVTVGGGGDGGGLLNAYVEFLLSNSNPGGFHSVIVTGPYCTDSLRTRLAERLLLSPTTWELRRIVDNFTGLAHSASGVVSMAGYNSVTELLGVPGRVMLAPRTRPRLEQAIRVRRLAELADFDVLRHGETSTQLGLFVESCLAAKAPRQPPQLRTDGQAAAAAQVRLALQNGRHPMPSWSESLPREPLRIGYVLKMYPRLSETFVVDEIRAVEETGAQVSIFSLRAPADGRFHRDISLVRGEAEYLPGFGSTSAMRAIELIAELGITPDTLKRATDFLNRIEKSRRVGVLTQALHLAEAVREKELEHLHAHFMTIAAHTAYLAHIFTGVPFTVTAHAKDIFRHGVDKEVFQAVGSAARAVVTVCDANQSFIEDQLLDGSGRVERIYNGVFLDGLGSEEERDHNLVLGVGRLVEKKGFEHLIRACRLLRERGTQVTCVIVGDGEQRSVLEDEIARNDLADVVVLTGPLARHEVASLMRRARLLAAPCVEGEDGNRDALPTVLLEALAQGLPVVTTDLGGIPEIVDHEKSGLLIEPGDTHLLADAIDAVLTDDELWDRLRIGGRLRAEERFDRLETGRHLVSVFEEGSTR